MDNIIGRKTQQTVIDLFQQATKMQLASSDSSHIYAN